MPLPAIAAPLLAKAGTAIASRGATGAIMRMGAKQVAKNMAVNKLSNLAPNAQANTAVNGGQAGSWMDANPSESHWGDSSFTEKPL